MSGIIQRLNAEMEQEFGPVHEDVGNKASVEEILASLEKMIGGDDTVTVTFDAIDSNGSMTAMKEGILYILPASELLLDAGGRASAKLLNKKYKFGIREVDYDERRVYLKLSGESLKEQEASVRNLINKEITKELSKKHQVLVWGRITSIKNGCAYVDIFDKGIQGVCHVAHWQKSYTRNIEDYAKVGDYFQFEVYKRYTAKGGVIAWRLGRKHITKDAWENIDLTAVEVGSAIKVCCMEKPVNKTYWWGHCDRFPGIEIMCDFGSDPFTQFDASKIYVGISYICNVLAIDVGKKVFKVIPFGVIEDDKKAFLKIAKAKGIDVNFLKKKGIV